LVAADGTAVDAGSAAEIMTKLHVLGPPDAAETFPSILKYYVVGGLLGLVVGGFAFWMLADG
jgi:hypothetical protein